MDCRRAVGGGRLTAEQLRELVVFRHLYHMDRAAVAALPVWEREALLQAGIELLNVATDDSDAGVVDGGPQTGSDQIRALLG